jgi:hypothetical protein
MTTTTARGLGLGIVAAALLLAVPLTIIIGSADLGTATPAPTARPGEPASVVPSAGFVTFTDDTALRVGADVPAGTYRTRTFSPKCSWERLGPDGNATAFVPGYAVVEILETDWSFESDGCREWSADLSAVTDSTSRFGAGTFIVGTDLLPGTWTATPRVRTLCTWSRLRGFTGESSEIIESGEVLEAPAAVIEATDAGFTSSGCGDWVRQ